MPTVTQSATQSVVLEGRGPVTIRPSNHIATGGQGSVYRLGDIAVKLYTDPSRVITDRLVDRVAYQSKFKHPGIAAPIGMVTSKHAPVGLYLPFVEGDFLSIVFTNDFWKAHNITTATINRIVESMSSVVAYAHGQKTLLIDANELNWLVDLHPTPTATAIDVDAWAIPNFKPTVIMPSIRDYTHPEFSELTDWFAWGIVTFQLYTGIHPYKGTLDGFAKGDLTARMRAGQSVFNPKVTLNAAVRPLSTIPSQLRNWYEATFQQNSRTTPPSPSAPNISAAPAAQTMRVTVQPDSTALTFEKVLSLPGRSITHVYPCGVARTDKGELVDITTKADLLSNVKDRPGVEWEVLTSHRGWLLVPQPGPSPVPILHSDAWRWSSLFVHSNNLSVTEVRSSIAAPATTPGFKYRVVPVADSTRLMHLNMQGLTQLNLLDLNPHLLAAGETWNLITNSTRWFDNVGVMDTLGSMWVIFPYDTAKVATVRVPELDRHQVITARAGHRFASFIVLEKTGDYKKIELSFAKDYTTYTAWTGPADSPELNLTVLPHGVCATIVKDGELDIFVPSNSQVRRVVDRHVTTDMSLCRWGSTVTIIWRGELWTVKLK